MSPVDPPTLRTHQTVCPCRSGEIKMKSRHPPPDWMTLNSVNVWQSLGWGHQEAYCFWSACELLKSKNLNFPTLSYFRPCILLLWHFHKGQGSHIHQGNKWQLTAAEGQDTDMYLWKLYWEMYETSHTGKKENEKCSIGFVQYPVYPKWKQDI